MTALAQSNDNRFALALHRERRIAGEHLQERFGIIGVAGRVAQRRMAFTS